MKEGAENRFGKRTSGTDAAGEVTLAAAGSEDDHRRRPWAGH